jgi:hypothetical protein
VAIGPVGHIDQVVGAPVAVAPVAVLAVVEVAARAAVRPLRRKIRVRKKSRVSKFKA